MSKLFCCAVLTVEQFFKEFNNFITRNSDDQEILHICEVINNGQKKSFIEGRFHVDEYYYLGESQFRVSQIQSHKICLKLQNIIPAFEEHFSVQLIIKKPTPSSNSIKRLNFFIGEYIFLADPIRFSDSDSSIIIKNYNKSTEDKIRKLFAWTMVDVHIDVYAI